MAPLRAFDSLDPLEPPIGVTRERELSAFAAVNNRMLCTTATMVCSPVPGSGPPHSFQVAERHFLMPLITRLPGNRDGVLACGDRLFNPARLPQGQA